MTHVVQGLSGVYGAPDKSGAQLAFEHVMLPLVGRGTHTDAWQEFARLCAIRDLWKTASPDWGKACGLAHGLLLFGSEKVLELVSKSQGPDFGEVMHVGGMIYEKILRQGKAVAKSSLKVSVNGSNTADVIIFNHADGGTMSDVAHVIMDTTMCSVVLGYFYSYDFDGTQQCVVSVRTNGNVSASALASAFGGGGHPKAAGFRICGDVSPQSVMKLVVQQIEKLT